MLGSCWGAETANYAPADVAVGIKRAGLQPRAEGGTPLPPANNGGGTGPQTLF